MNSKPYEFVPFLSQKKHLPVGNQYSGKILIRLTALTDISVLSGELIEEGRVAYAFARNGDKIIIPGSSLKGAVRTVAEAASHSCGYVISYDKKNRDKIQLKKNVCSECITCDMFGFLFHKTSKKSKVSINDFIMTSGKVETKTAPSLFSPQVEKCIEDENIKGIKFYYHGNGIAETGEIPTEVAVKDSTFKGEIFYKDLDEQQLGLLLFAIGGGEDSIQLKIGHNKPGYWGSVQTEILSFEVKEGEWKAESLIGQYVSQPEIMENVEKLKEILCYKNARINSDWHDFKNSRVY